MDYFSQRSHKLLAGLRAHNNREWFEAHRDEIEELLLAPARWLVVETGAMLSAILPDLVAEPRIDRSIYRLRRDTRFSKDKNPYKSHLGLIWWLDRPEGKLESPCFYFHLEPDGWLWSAGCYRFSDAALLTWRNLLATEDKAADWLNLAAKLQRAGLTFNEPELKRAPAGSSEAASPWLRRKGLYTWPGTLTPAGPELWGPGAAKLLFDHFKTAVPLMNFLKNLYELRPPSAAPPARRGGARPGRYAEDF
ncbi:MAG: DUF2461 domain-containing protein [Deltaproteobacteria bacterium]|jgi:uncharacterized protein (TIGR02453 family)|nr:DUF2461 domain-containing protein [Deltaproteobacteria bacterium]